MKSEGEIYIPPGSQNTIEAEDQVSSSSGAKFEPKFGLGQKHEGEEDDHPKKSLNLLRARARFLGAKNQFKIWQPRVHPPPPKQMLHLKKSLM